VETGYDLVMILWGVVFILGAVGFILAMNRVFVSEEQRQENLAETADSSPMGMSH
jgi:hypothetical protein